MKTIFIYGSLRKGRYNHYVIKDAEFLGQSVMYGWDLYSLGNYPAIVKGDGRVVIEAYRVTDEQYERIDWMEEGAGYKKESATIVLYGNYITGDFWYRPKKPNGELVSSGDWNEFREVKQNVQP